MQTANRMSMLLDSIVLALMVAIIFFSPAFAKGTEPAHPQMIQLAHPPHQDPTPAPPPPPADGGGDQNIIQNITQLINFPFESLVEALQNAIQNILRAALAPIQSMFEAVLALWLENPGILSNGNAALPGWDLMKDAWQFMYSIAIAFWPLTLAVVAAIAAKDAVAASTWGLGDLKSALGTWFAAVLLSATSLWWMDLANNLANAITKYILYNFAGPQFSPSTFMVLFTVVLPGLFLAFPLAGIIIIMFLVILAITIFVGLTFGIIARLVLMYLVVALGPLAIILGVLPPLRFVTQMWMRGFLLVLALGPVDALLLKLAFNIAQYASSAPPVQAAAAFIGVFGLLSILITINFTVVKGVFGAAIAVAHQTIGAVKTVGQMVVAGALLMTGAGAGAGAALGGSTAAGAAAGGTGGGGAGGGGAGGALGGASSGIGSANAEGGMPSRLSAAGFGNGNGAKGGNGNSPWRPSGRGIAAAGNYLQSTRGPLAGFGALLRAAGIEQTQQERAGRLNVAGNSPDTRPSLDLENVGSPLRENESPLPPLSRGNETEEREGPNGDDGNAATGGASAGASLAGGQAQLTDRDPMAREERSASGEANATGETAMGTRTGDQVRSAATGRASAVVGSSVGRSQGLTLPATPAAGVTDVRAAVQTSHPRGGWIPPGGSAGGNVPAPQGGNTSGTRTGADTASSQRTGISTDSPNSLRAGSGERAAMDTGTGIGADPSAPPRRANPAAIDESRAAMGFAPDLNNGTNTDALAGASDSESRENAGGMGALERENSETASSTDALADESADAVAQNAGAVGGTSTNAVNDESGSTFGGENVEMVDGGTAGTMSNDLGLGEAATAESTPATTNIPSIAQEADRTLSMLPEGSDEARWQAAQLVSSYPSAGEQAQTAMALEQAMHTANEQNGIGWSQMGSAMERGLWSTREAADNGIGFGDMARQMEPFTGSREMSDYLGWQIAGHGEQFQMPSQQFAYLPAPGPYDYQAGHYVEQQLSNGISRQDAAQIFYVIRDPSTPGGGWTKAQAFVSEVNRISSDKAGDPLIELDRWMQTNAPTRARIMWNMHFRMGDGK